MSVTEQAAAPTVHIVDDAGTWYGADEVVALCGRRGRFDDDGDLISSGFDFVEPPNEANATCRWCRETRGLSPVAVASASRNSSSTT